MPYKKTAAKSVTVDDFVGKPSVNSPDVAKSVNNESSKRRIHISSVHDTVTAPVSPVIAVKADLEADKVLPVKPTIPEAETAKSSISGASSYSISSQVRSDAVRTIPFKQNNGGQISDVKQMHSAVTPQSGYAGQGAAGGVYQPAIQSVPTDIVRGFLDIQIEGHGFLRPKFIPSSKDIYISQSQIRRFMLRPGDEVEGVARPPKDTERYYGLLKVEKVNKIAADDSLRRPYFDDLTAIYPNKQVVLSTGKTPMSTRLIDLIAPIGFGQRGMIVSPPKAGKTTILKEIAAGISKNFPKAHLMAALIGERPEEVTDISMSVKGEVVASNFDEPPDNQTRVAEITLDRAKRLVELGVDVIILLDSITRLARAYNLSVDPSGRTLSGGFDPAALYPAKRFFGAARNCQEGGSLTIIGTALVETGSRMDDLIYEEFKGTGNMELHLVRSLAERRIYPAMSVERSGTRGEERILSEGAYKKIVTMRRMMDMLGADERTSILVERLGKTENNEEFLETLGRG